MDLSLSRVCSLLALLPRYTRPTIHIAGTNGKGSVTAFLDSILRQAHFRTGRFNTPHLLEIRDSISIDGYPLSLNAYNAIRSGVEKANAVGATTFELLTATALQAFENEGVDVAILEVGLGGRLDATNVIPDDVILISGIASVDLDHQAILGNTVQQIAREKAGIARKNKVLVLSGQKHPSVCEAVVRAVEDVGGTVVLAKDVVAVTAAKNREVDDVSFTSGQITITYDGHTISTNMPLLGLHQLDNASLAVAIIMLLRQLPSFKHITDDHISQGIAQTNWPGRLERRVVTLTNGASVEVLVDGAHNPASASALNDYLSAAIQRVPRTFVIALSYSPPKTPRSILEQLLRQGDRVAAVSFSPVEGMPWVKSVPLDNVTGVASDLLNVPDSVAQFASLQEALSWAASWRCPIVLCGSLYLVSDFYRLRSH